MPTGANGTPVFSPNSVERGSVEKLMSSTISPRRRAGIGTWVKTLNIGTTDLPLFTRTSLVSQSGCAVPSYGDPPMSRKVAFVTGVDAGTVTPTGRSLVAPPSPATGG